MEESDIWCVDVSDVPSLKYFLPDGKQQEVNLCADLTLALDENLVSNDGLYSYSRKQNDETALRGDLYRLEVIGAGTLTVADFGLPAWEQSQLEAAIAGTYPIKVSEGGSRRLFLERDFVIE